jgi:hypothetical protein
MPRLTSSMIVTIPGKREPELHTSAEVADLV